MSKALTQEGGASGKNTTAQAADPLVPKARKKNNSGLAPRAGIVVRYTAMTVVPFTVYVIMLFLAAFVFYGSPLGVFLTYTILAGLSILEFLVITHCLREKVGWRRWRRWIGFISFFAATAGLVVGLLIHYKCMLYYYKYKNMMTYANVAASQPAPQFEDAGSLIFTSGTKVDSTRAVGYRNIRESKTLCVAPVVDNQMAATDPIVFFAVGVGCCGWRSSFHCDSAKKREARSGVLMLEPNRLVSPAMEWMVDEQFNFKGFEDAIDLQKSVFAVNVAKDYRFLRWVQDPKDEVDMYRKRGLEACLLSCLAFFGVAFAFVARDITVQDAKNQKAVEQLTKGMV